MTMAEAFVNEHPFDERYREATVNINATVRAIHDSLQASKIDAMPDLLGKMADYLIEFKVLHNQLILSDEEDISDFSCAKDTIAEFNKAIDQIIQKIKMLEDKVEEPNPGINFLHDEMEKITIKLKSLENARSEISFCGYYNEVGVLD
ncbi:MAG: hypothetical protein A2X86_08365 [Bdellovibrionales bacterium GWA2_49_15]|nr:MAG: hypothetical protein A2X86_08365 [Bdellovibrionales bacterium GWA2_49_15]HAZ11225.1 hypothetical protein [Bdellovibrionales bacterium]